MIDFLKEKRGSLEYRGEKILEGIFEGKSDEDIGKISAIVSDFFIIGDIRDLVIEGSNYINDRDVDKIIVALSTLGVYLQHQQYTHLEQLPQLKMQYQY